MRWKVSIRRATANNFLLRRSITQPMAEFSRVVPNRFFVRVPMGSWGLGMMWLAPIRIRVPLVLVEWNVSYYPALTVYWVRRTIPRRAYRTSHARLLSTQYFCPVGR